MKYKHNKVVYRLSRIEKLLESGYLYQTTFKKGAYKADNVTTRIPLSPNKRNLLRKDYELLKKRIAIQK